MEETIKYKQYVLVPKMPKMSKGKIASQVAHATFMAIEKQKDKRLIEEWKKNGMCVIVLEVKNIVYLLGADKYMDQWEIPHHLYIDEGLTEVHAFAPTVLSTGVLTEDKFWMFETLGLMK